MSNATTVIKQYSTLDGGEIDRLIGMNPAEVVGDSAFVTHISGLDLSVLEETLPVAREALNAVLPGLAEEMTEKYQLERNPMSAYTLGNWLIGFAQNTEQLAMLINMHQALPKGLIDEYLGQIVASLDDLDVGRDMWQDGISTMVIPLLTR